MDDGQRRSLAIGDIANLKMSNRVSYLLAIRLCHAWNWICRQTIDTSASIKSQKILSRRTFTGVKRLVVYLLYNKITIPVCTVIER